MPINVENTTSVNKKVGKCYERNQFVERLIKVFSEHRLSECQTLRYNLIENAKKIESDLYEMAESEIEYSRLITEKIEDIQNKINEKIQEIKEKANPTQAAIFRDSQGWRFFFSPTLRQAVVNAFIEDVRKKVDVPFKYTFGLRIGVEQIENFAFKAGGNKVDYFSILERKKEEITSELKAYFEEDY